MSRRLTRRESARIISGRRVYVANGHGNSISVIDAAKRKAVKIVPVGKRPWGVALTPDGRKLYLRTG